ncbi:DNA-deoxyinosine glycosylase [Nitrosophilus kaiyonis]|uniref:DNA-deoxyinosine glycosylase n=1 Tax=Nitrosophilus kaiyonis TaxID=2930200 RepID=UPI0024917176|nr:DNA-deoxyinosine glycosylase [Nitrosophilus kaiyonis]
MPKLSHPFKPIIDKNSKILILGSFPSQDSFKNSFYYGHKFNQFWKLISAIFEENEPKTVEEKISFLKNHHIALWDMAKECRRVNSSDSNLKEIKVNDIESLVKEYPNIKAIFFTGRLAQKLYEKHFSHLNIPTYYLPSPSPAYRKMSFEEKLKKWEIIKDILNKR